MALATAAAASKAIPGNPMSRNGGGFLRKSNPDREFGHGYSRDSPFALKGFDGPINNAYQHQFREALTNHETGNKIQDIPLAGGFRSPGNTSQSLSSITGVDSIRNVPNAQGFSRIPDRDDPMSGTSSNSSNSRSDRTPFTSAQISQTQRHGSSTSQGSGTQNPQTRNSNTQANPSTNSRGTLTNGLDSVGRRNKDEYILAAGYATGQAIAGLAHLGSSVYSSNKALEGVKDTNRTTLVNTQQQYNNLKDYTGMKSAALQQAGLPSYLAFSNGSMPTPPLKTQVVSGQHAVTSHLPGNPTSTPFTGSGAQIATGWGNQMQ